MDNVIQEHKPKKSQIKIIVPILIIAIVIGIWFTKNPQSPAENVTSGQSDFGLQVIDELNIEQLKSYGLPIMIDFGADSCVPCREMAPVLEKLNEELQGKAIIKFVDVWKYQKLAEGYPISVIPTQVFFDKEGKPYVPSEPNSIPMISYSTKDTNEHVYTIHEGGMTEEMIRTVLKDMGLEE